MSIIKNMVGLSYDRLTVISPRDNNKSGCAMWFCKCTCGTVVLRRGTDLRSGKVKSCGCITSENLVKRNYKHGHALRKNYSCTYESWRGMIERCTNQSSKYYHNYGGAGIKICKEWISDFRVFLKDMGERPKNLTINRIDTLGNYTKENCRWATRSEQALNRKYQWNHLKINKE